MPRGKQFTIEIPAHAFAMDHNRKIYAVYFVDVKLQQPVTTPKNTSTSSTETKTTDNNTNNSDGSSTSNSSISNATSSTATAPSTSTAEEDSGPPQSWTVFRRYNHFRSLMEKVKKAGHSTPGLPPKRFLKSNFDPEFLRERRGQLEEWLRTVLGLQGNKSAEDAASLKRDISVRRFLTAKANTPPFRMTTPVVAANAESEFSKRASQPAAAREASLADFQLIQMLGVGAYGRVILVEQRNSGNLYAMKVLSKAAAMEAKQMEYINTERRLLVRFIS